MTRHIVTYNSTNIGKASDDAGGQQPHRAGWETQPQTAMYSMGTHKATAANTFISLTSSGTFTELYRSPQPAVQWVDT